MVSEATEAAGVEDDGSVRSASPGRATFSVRVGDLTIPYRVFLITAMPRERVPIRVVPTEGDSTLAFDVEAAGGEVRRLDRRSWSWTAPPEPGLHPLRVRRLDTGEIVTLNAVVLVPMERVGDGRIEGYPVGTYPSEPYRGLPRYEAPPGLIRMTAEDADLPVSPHLTLGQFPQHRPATWPKYLVLDGRLLLKLERLLERARRRGIDVTRFRVLSGYRSPWYNRSIGRPLYSRHIYGDAADVYVDEDGDGRMDDLDGDGRVGLRDADLLHRIVEAMDASGGRPSLVGGLGKYPTTPNHGPFIHVDVREYRARW